MKERVLAITGDGTASKSGALFHNLNNSGKTGLSMAAKREIAAGDTACSSDDLATARRHYQRAVDDLTTRD